jgi:hypothetical protein
MQCGCNVMVFEACNAAAGNIFCCGCSLLKHGKKLHLSYRAAAAGCCRFDVVLLLLDQHEPTWDQIVSDHVLTTHQQVPSCMRVCLLSCAFHACGG